MKNYRKLITLTLATLLKNFFPSVRGFTIVNRDYTRRHLTILHIEQLTSTFKPLD